MKVKEIVLEKAVVQHRHTFTKEDIKEFLEIIIGAGVLLMGTSFLAMILYAVGG